MRARPISCCFSGHRPGKLPWGDDEGDRRCLALKERLWTEMEAAIPCPSQAEGWPAEQRLRWQRLVAACDYETMVQQQYSPGCMQRRNRYMVDHASLLIAVHDGLPGGTRRTIEYALRRGIGIVDIPVG